MHKTDTLSVLGTSGGPSCAQALVSPRMSLNTFPRPYAIPKNITRALLRLERTINLFGGRGGMGEGEGEGRREGGREGGEGEGREGREGGREGREGWGREGGREGGRDGREGGRKGGREGKGREGGEGREGRGEITINLLCH